jgi:peptidoglycan-associated lipoprotein
MNQTRVFLSLIIFVAFACSPGKMAMKKGNKRFNTGEYDLSIDYYNKAIANDHLVGEANFKIGESYRLSNRIKEALPYYEVAVEKGYNPEESKLYYAIALKNNEKYQEAKRVLDQLTDAELKGEIKDLTDQEMENLIKLEEIINKKSYFEVKNLDLINTPAAEYAAYYYNGELYFTSSRDGGKIYKATGTPFTKIYKVKTKGAIVDTTTVMQLPSYINSENTNDGTIAISPDGSTMIFAKGNSGRKKGSEDVDLYISRFRRNQWTEPTIMRVNDPKAWDSTPAFTQDGNSLIFASNRKGGFGGTDLYIATINRRGRFGRVQNLGPEINTAGNEMFPHVGEDGSIYFASNGHPGLGGLDIFKVTRESGKLNVENLGSPVNSSSDDFAMFLYTIDKGFFSSNRESGAGDDDIYTFRNEDPNLKIVNYFLVGTTVTNTEEGEKILPGTVVKLQARSDSTILSEKLSDRDGQFRFRVYPEEDYFLIAEKTDYLTSRSTFSTVGKTIPKDQLTQLVTNKIFETKVALDQIVIDKAIVVENIYYDLDKWDIREDAAQELDKLVTMLEDNPEIKIELSSHTDSRQTADYNLDLSKKRAQSAVDYIVSQGIDPDRLVARGYGESELLISDEEINELPTPEARERAHQRNRRTEFKILEFDPSKSIKEEDEEDEIDELELVETEEDKKDLESKIDWDN